jgi:hypothetical protein
MISNQEPVEIESKLDNGTKIATKGTRAAIVTDAKTIGHDYTMEDFTADLAALATQFGVTPARLAEQFDSNVINVRWYQDAGRNAMRDGGVPLSQAELDEAAKERATATGRGGAKGPRLSDAEVIEAVNGLVAKNASFQPLKDLIDNTPMNQYKATVAKLRADFQAAGLSITDVKALAKATPAVAAAPATA